MRRLFLFSLFAVAACFTVNGAPAEKSNTTPRKPNVLFIAVDDPLLVTTFGQRLFFVAAQFN